VLIGASGAIEAVYRKIHLFDVNLGPTAACSPSRRASRRAKRWWLPTPRSRRRLSVCYDLRFPELYRAQSARGARWLLVPSAFARATGKDHWEVLLRARAIENQCFVLAPAQCGVHSPTARATAAR